MEASLRITVNSNIIEVALPFTSPNWYEETSMIFSLCKIQAAESPKNLINTWMLKPCAIGRYIAHSERLLKKNRSGCANCVASHCQRSQVKEIHLFIGIHSPKTNLLIFAKCFFLFKQKRIKLVALSVGRNHSWSHFSPWISEVSAFAPLNSAPKNLGFRQRFTNQNVVGSFPTSGSLPNRSSAWIQLTPKWLMTSDPADAMIQKAPLNMKNLETYQK